MRPYRAELRALALLSAPVVATQLGVMLRGVVDVLMVSRVSVEALGGVALGNMWAWTWLSAAHGVILGMDPLVSQAHGERDGAGAALALQRALVLAVALSAGVAGAWLLAEPALRLLGQEPVVAELAADYLWARLPGVAPFLAYIALRQYLQGRALVRPAMWLMLGANIVNLFANWVLIFGHLGLPALGVVGAGYATALTNVLLLLGLAGWIRLAGLHAGAWRHWDRASLSGAGLGQIARLGLPVGLQMTLEAWAFSLATLMAGWLGVHALGSHQIAMNLISFFFMVPLGISISAATRVGNLIGELDAEGAQRAGRVALGLGAAVMLVSATGFALGRFALPRLYTDDLLLVQLCAAILPVAAVFQVFDGVQVVGTGILRGMGRPQAAALVNLIGYYALALPLSYWLGFRWELGLAGVWWGMAAGLAVVALALTAWVHRTGQRPLSELRVRLR